MPTLILKSEYNYIAAGPYNRHLCIGHAHPLHLLVHGNLVTWRLRCVYMMGTGRHSYKAFSSMVQEYNKECGVGALTPWLYVDDENTVLPLKLRLYALGTLHGLQHTLFVGLICVGDCSPKTAVMGTRSCYCVYFCEKRLYSNCFVSNEYVQGVKLLICPSVVIIGTKTAPIWTLTSYNGD